MGLKLTPSPVGEKGTLGSLLNERRPDPKVGLHTLGLHKRPFEGLACVNILVPLLVHLARFCAPLGLPKGRRGAEYPVIRWRRACA